MNDYVMMNCVMKDRLLKDQEMKDPAMKDRLTEIAEKAGTFILKALKVYLLTALKCSAIIIFNVFWFAIRLIARLMVNCLIWFLCSGLIWGRFKGSIHRSPHYLAIGCVFADMVHTLCRWK